jgi:polysaccharide pyruvyl transferase CsaB
VAEEGRGFVLARLSLDTMVERTRVLYARLAQKEATKAPRTRVFSSKKETPHSPCFLGRRKKVIPHKPSFFCKKRGKNPHLLVGGYFGCGNLGDDAILLGLLSLLRELAPEMRVSVLSGDPRATRALCRVDAYRRKSPLALLRAFLNADAFLLGGGSLLQNRTGRLSLAYYLGLLRLSRFLKKPTALFAAGIGPLLGETDRQKTRLVLSSLFHVGLRDPLSLSALRSLGLPASLLSLGSDPAFFITPTCNTLVGSDLAFFLHSFPTFTANTPKKKQLSPTLQKKEREKAAPFPTVPSEKLSPSGKEAEDCLPKNRVFPTCDANLQKRRNFSPTLKQKEGDFAENRLLLLLRSCRDLPELPKILSLRVGKFCRENGLSLLLLPMDLRADLTLSRQGAELGGGRLLCPKDPRELLALLSASRACVTLRLHGAILSSSAGLPCLCISPDREDQKLAAFSETLGQEHLSSTEAADGARLDEALSRLLKKDAAFSHRLLLAVEEERKKARKDLAKLLEMLYNERR